MRRPRTRLALDAREDLPCKQQVLPGLALLAGTAQQVGRVIRDDQRPVARHRRNAPCRAAWRSACPWRAGLRRDAPNGDHERRVHEFDLPLEVTAAADALPPGFGSRLFGGRHFRMFAMKTSSRANPSARIIALSSCPARPTNGSPCRSSSMPGASPMNIQRALRLPTPKTVCVRVECSVQRSQAATAARSSSQSCPRPGGRVRRRSRARTDRRLDGPGGCARRTSAGGNGGVARGTYTSTPSASGRPPCVAPPSIYLPVPRPACRNDGDAGSGARSQSSGPELA